MLAAEPLPYDQVSADPVPASRIVVDRDVPDVDIRGSEAIRCLIANRFSADLHGLVFSHSPVSTKTTSVELPPIGSFETPVILKSASDRWSVAPKEIEGVALGSALIILNVNHRNAPVISWIAGENLAASTIDTREPEVLRVGGHRPCALEASPLRILATGVTQGGAVPANFDLG